MMGKLARGPIRTKPISIDSRKESHSESEYWLRVALQMAKDAVDPVTKIEYLKEQDLVAYYNLRRLLK